jgi:hypothetical protein
MGDDESWLLEAVMAFLKSSRYTTPVMNFIDEKSLVFDSEDENKLEFTAVHEEFVALVFGSAPYKFVYAQYSGFCLKLWPKDHG